MEEENFQPTDEFINLPKGNNKRRWFIIAALSLIFVSLILVVVYILVNKRNISRKTVMEINEEQLLKEQYTKNLQQTYLVDKDFDGITDEDEKKYGTSPTSSDTDADGILDRDEINIYKTDPLKADSDGDGHNDGYEVRRGYNPNGAGML